MNLKELLGEELYNQLIAKLGDKHEIAIVNDGNWFPKSKFDEANEAKKKLESDLADRDKQLETLKADAGTSEELKKQIETLQAENKANKEKYESDLKEIKLTSAIKTALVGKVHDEDLVAGLFDREKLVIGDDGKIVGLDEQLKGLQESKGFLFKAEEDPKPPRINRVGGGGGGDPEPKDLTLKDAIEAHLSQK